MSLHASATEIYQALTSSATHDLKQFYLRFQAFDVEGESDYEQIQGDGVRQQKKQAVDDYVKVLESVECESPQINPQLAASHIMTEQNPQNSTYTVRKIGCIYRPRKMVTEGAESDDLTFINTRTLIKDDRTAIKTDISQTPKGLKHKHQIPSRLKHKSEGKEILKNLKHSPGQHKWRSYVNSKKDKYNMYDRESFQESQLNKKVQLKVLYSRKTKLQQKMKKLDRELKSMQAQKIVSILQKQELTNPLHQIRYQGKLIQRSPANDNSFHSRTKSRHIFNTEIEKNINAMNFVERISQQSLQRRIRHHKQVNQSKVSRVSEQVSMECSRVRCQIEVMEGQLKCDKI